MRWQEAVREISPVRCAGEGEITSVAYDSRRVLPGTAFIAMRGGTTDGNRFVDAALAKGASAIVTDSVASYERLRGERPEVAVALVERGRRALAELSAAVLGHPERRLALCGVTGTNGKTTTAFLLEQMLQFAGRETVLIGTIETHVAGEVRPSPHTTPESSDVLEIFRDGVERGATEAVMEMSSHALDQERVWGLPVDVAIFTNLTQDHLDYHGTMESYRAAKVRLFEGVGAAAPRVAVLNADDAEVESFRAAAKGAEQMLYGISSGGAEYRAEGIVLDAGRTEFRFVTPVGAVEIVSRLTGRVNVLNLLAAGCAALARGLRLEQIAEYAPRLMEVPGRFQVVPGSAEAGFTVVVDYAHTDDALRNLMALARELARTRGGRVITLFGCGGDRDRTKRPKMGRAAAEGSDLVILTSDNPRTEDPMRILEEALAGVRAAGGECVVDPDREAAIRYAVRQARAGDMVLLAGKGHEKVQIVGDKALPFDDVEVAARALRERGEG